MLVGHDSDLVVRAPLITDAGEEGVPPWAYEFADAVLEEPDSGDPDGVAPTLSAGSRRDGCVPAGINVEVGWSDVSLDELLNQFDVPTTANDGAMAASLPIEPPSAEDVALLLASVDGRATADALDRAEAQDLDGPGFPMAIVHAFIRFRRHNHLARTRRALCLLAAVWRATRPTVRSRGHRRRRRPAARAGPSTEGEPPPADFHRQEHPHVEVVRRRIRSAQGGSLRLTDRAGRHLLQEVL